MGSRKLWLAVVVMLMAGCSGASPSASLATPSPAPPTASPAPSPTASAAPAPTGLPTPSTGGTLPTAGGWRPVPDQASVTEVEFLHVVWTGARFVATGVTLDDSGGTFLDSSDGLVWHRQPASTARVYPGSLTAGPGGVVAVGTMNDEPASWFSPDGMSWTVRADAFPATPTGSDTIRVTAVVATDHGWLAVGREDLSCNTNCGLAPVRAMAWTSSDGLHWVRIPDQASFSTAAMTGVVRSGAGFVAVGNAGIHAAAWASPDGVTWSRIRDSSLFHALPNVDPSLWTLVEGVAAGHGVVVAVGTDGPGGGHGPTARAWWTADGLTWAQASGDGFMQGELRSVAATAEGFLAIGASSERCLGGIWASVDAQAWQCSAANRAMAGFDPWAAAASESAEIAVGYGGGPEPHPDGLPGAVWWRPVP